MSSVVNEVASVIGHLRVLFLVKTLIPLTTFKFRITNNKKGKSPVVANGWSALRYKLILT